MNRRLFLGAMAGLVAAPPVVRSGILMPVKPVRFYSGGIVALPAPRILSTGLLDFEAKMLRHVVRALAAPEARHLMRLMYNIPVATRTRIG